jgi:hypothetical protein
MSERPDATNELRELLAALREDVLTEKQAERLTSLLHDDGEARQMYIRYMAIEAYLHGNNTFDSHRVLPKQLGTPVDRQGSGDALTSDVPGLPIVIQTPTGFPSMANPLGGWMFSYLAAIVIVGIGLLIGWMCQVSISSGNHQEVARQPSPDNACRENKLVFVGRISGMTKCQWADPKTEPFNGDRVPLGREYTLMAGLMEITYDTGVKVIIEGPCSYVAESMTGGYLSLGKLTANVKGNGDGGKATVKKSETSGSISKFQIAESAPQFRVRTPTAIVTDLGTEFGVECNKSGVTRSTVFRGVVALQAASAAGMPQGPAKVLRENESAGIGENGNFEIISGVSAKPDNFIRKMPKLTIRSFSLLDVAAGGNGFSSQRNRGINPANGQITDLPTKENKLRGDRRYHRVAAMPFIDGVFIPNGGSGPVQVDSVGHTCADFPKTDNWAPGVIWVYGDIPADAPTKPTVLGGVDYSSADHSAMLLHANQAITFDLDAIRRANPDCKLLCFRAVAGNTETVSVGGDTVYADLWVLVDGQVRYQRQKINSFNGVFHISIPLGKSDHFLTLAGTDGGDGVKSDWIVFGDARLELMAVEPNQTTTDFSDK